MVQYCSLTATLSPETCHVPVPTLQVILVRWKHFVLRPTVVSFRRLMLQKVELLSLKSASLSLETCQVPMLTAQALSSH